MKVDTNDPRPAYMQVADGLRASIQSGELAAGTKLPSGRDLSREWGVALMTLQKAIDQLRDEGLVYSQQGRGVFVAAGNGDVPTDNLAALREAVENLGRRLAAVEKRLDTSDGTSK